MLSTRNQKMFITNLKFFGHCSVHRISLASDRQLALKPTVGAVAPLFALQLSRPLFL